MPPQYVGLGARLVASAGSSAPVEVAESGRLGRLVRIAVVVLAALCWGQSYAWLSFTPAMFWAWWRARTRLEALLLVALYFAVAARGLAAGAASIFGIHSFGAWGLITICALLVGAAQALCWTSPTALSSWARSWLRICAWVALSVAPPLCALAVPSPLSAAGVWFPALGWLGLLAWTVVVAWMRRGSVGPALLMVVAFLNARHQQLRVAPDVATIEASFDASASDPYAVSSLLRQREIAQQMIGLVGRTNAPLSVVPEGLGGMWEAPMRRMWQPLSRALRAQGRAALVGVTTPHAQGFRSAVAVLGSAETLYVQRVPMPLALWRPWARTGSFEPNWWGRGTVRVADRDLGVLVCWEIGVAWAVLGSVASGADALVGVANLAWLRGTQASAAQDQMLRSWGALFDLPIARAANL